MAVVTVVLVSTTFAYTDVQPLRLTVQRNVAGEEVTVTVEVGEYKLLIVAAPPTTVHVPVAPVGAAVAAMINELLPHFVWSPPQAVAVGQGVTIVKQIPSNLSVLQAIEPCTLTLVVPMGAIPESV